MYLILREIIQQATTLFIEQILTVHPARLTFAPSLGAVELDSA